VAGGPCRCPSYLGSMSSSTGSARLAPTRRSAARRLRKVLRCESEPAGRDPFSSGADFVAQRPAFRPSELERFNGFKESKRPDFLVKTDSLQDFDSYSAEEIERGIAERRNTIFLLMEEVRRLRIQGRVRGARGWSTKGQQGNVVGQSVGGANSASAEGGGGELDILNGEVTEEFESSIPGLPPLTKRNLNVYYRVFWLYTIVLILLGGIVAPTLEINLGVGGQSYADFIEALHLPRQLALVDPVVASATGGAVGVMTALLLVEINNVERQEAKNCMYCQGSGYLPCSTCMGTGAGSCFVNRDVKGNRLIELSGPGAEDDICPMCSGVCQVMCTSCLSTGKAMVTEHDRRLDPFA